VTILAVTCITDGAHCGPCGSRALDQHHRQTCKAFDLPLSEDRDRKPLRCDACLAAERFAQALLDGTHQPPVIGGARG
jgi:hypothetical protein